MKTALTIFFILVAIFALAVIVSSIRKAIRKSREIRHRLEVTSRFQGGGVVRGNPFNRDREIPAILSEGREFFLPTAEAEALRDRFRQRHPNMAEAWDRAGLTRPEGKSGERIVGMHPALGVGYGKDVPMAFNPDTDEFFPANQLPGTCPLCDGFLEHAQDCPQFILAVMGEEPIRGEYVDPDTHVITVTTLQPGEPLPQSPPNIGGIGHPEYRGPNYAAPEEIADEMKHVIQWDSPDGTEFPADHYRKD